MKILPMFNSQLKRQRGRPKDAGNRVLDLLNKRKEKHPKSRSKKVKFQMNQVVGKMQLIKRILTQRIRCVHIFTFLILLLILCTHASISVVKCFFFNSCCYYVPIYVDFKFPDAEIKVVIFLRQWLYELVLYVIV